MMMSFSKILTLFAFLGLFIGISFVANAIENNGVDAKEKQTIGKVLNRYISCRSSADFQCCSKLLSASYLSRFSKENGYPYVEFYKTTETHYHEAKITRMNKLDDGAVEAIVESYSEEPGVLSKDTETYRMKRISGSWRIDDFSVNFRDSKIVKEIKADGEWHDVKQK